jgi:hypothetical protein
MEQVFVLHSHTQQLRELLPTQRDWVDRLEDGRPPVPGQGMFHSLPANLKTWPCPKLDQF